VFQWIYRWLDGARHQGRRRQEPPDFVAGRRAEDLAHRHLESRGFTVIARNWRAPGGAEVDLIALDGGRTVFVEVKARSSTEFGSPERAIDAMKLRALSRAAASWRQAKGLPAERLRFDLVTVVLSDPPRLEHERDAWSLAPPHAGRTIG
jgi:putative endonuclease